MKSSKLAIGLAVGFIVLIFGAAVILNLHSKSNADETASDKNTAATAATKVIYPDGVYTDGLASMVFSGKTVDVSGMVFDYTLEDGYIVLDGDSLSFSDALLDEFKNVENMTDDQIDTQLKTSQDAAAELKIQYNGEQDWITYEEDIYVKTEDYSKAPTGTYTSGSDENVTLTFDNGTATYTNGDTTETTPYVVYDDVNGMEVVFYAADFELSNLYTAMGTNYFYYDDLDSFEIASDVFTK